MYAILSIHVFITIDCDLQQLIYVSWYKTIFALVIRTTCIVLTTASTIYYCSEASLKEGCYLCLCILMKQNLCFHIKKIFMHVVFIILFC